MKHVAHRKNTQNIGFTIVELLIVVVIIAILATISTATYANFQERANAAKAASIVTQYAKIFELYKLEQGRYPSSIDMGTGMNGITICLGPPDKLPSDGTFEDSQCANWTSSTASHFAREEFSSLIRPLVSDVIPGNIQTVAVDRGEGDWENYRGVMYGTTWDGSNGFMHYFLNGTQTCPKGDTYHYDDATECVVSLDGSSTEDEWGVHGGEGWWL